jgi:hypothetical protein
MESIKEKIVLQCKLLIDSKIELNRSAMITAQEGANEEKGMMGDKFESFREQLQIERDRYAELYEKALFEAEYFSKIDFTKPNERIMLGALAYTDAKIFLVSVGIGNIEVGDLKVMGISTQSPLYQAMAGRKVGETFVFNGKKYIVKKIV